MTQPDPRVEALAERLYGFGLGPRDARMNVARRFIEVIDAVDPLRNAQPVESVVELAARERAVVTSRRSTERRA